MQIKGWMRIILLVTACGNSLWQESLQNVSLFVKLEFKHSK